MQHLMPYASSISLLHDVCVKVNKFLFLFSISVRSSSESNFNPQNKRTASANLTETSNSLFYSTDIKISETPEVNAFLELVFELFAREVAYLGYGDSKLQKFLYACLEICHQNCKDESHFNLSPQNEEFNGYWRLLCTMYVCMHA